MKSNHFMEKLLGGERENHIFPFLWLREQSEETLRTEIEKIYGCGIRALCLESRPHPDFGGPGWWHDFDIVLDEAKKKDMKIWILDDAHFPTGQANGLLPKKYPERARKYLMMQYTDCTGPVVHASLDVELMMTKKFTWMDFGKKVEKPLIDKSELVSVTAVRLEEGDVIGDEVTDLTGHVKDGLLSWDVPEGVWRICISFITYDFGAYNDSINYIDRDSVKVLLEAVYEMHYEKYAEQFGKTIAGFFSDEPGFYNVGNYEMYNAVGRKDMPLPWCDELEKLMAEKNPGWKMKIPYLWLDSTAEEIPAGERRCYMDLVSSLYEKNFSRQLGEWCEEHGVSYIGHVIEDYEEHSRLGCGAGHYFRAMAGQNMAGIDDIGGQIIPGNPYGARHGVTAVGDGSFYHFALAKMGASAAQLDPKKKGRLMCEAFGAYGWNFGVKSMKWLTDYLLFQGVNHFVPHAFSMAEYPDMDCPPHFYARGNNPQYPYFSELMQYANRMCELLSNGKHNPRAAVIYPGEHDWMNECMKLQQPGRFLLENQIDYEVVPVDVFYKRDYFGAKIQDKELIINGIHMPVLIVPQTHFLDAGLAAVIKEAVEEELEVIFIDRLPEYIVGNQEENKEVLQSIVRSCPVVALEKLVPYLREMGVEEIVLERAEPELLLYHYSREREIYCLFNMSLSRTINNRIFIEKPGTAVRYDAMKNCLLPVEQKPAGSGVEIALNLAPYESIVLVMMKEEDEIPDLLQKEYQPGEMQDISGDWMVSMVKAKRYPDFPVAQRVQRLEPISVKHPEFAGIMRYEKTFEMSGKRRVVFAPQYIYEAAEAYVNGVSAGKKLTPPYRWDISELCRPGENHLAVEVVNTPTRDTLKTFTPFGPDREIMEPSGMFGRIVLE